MTLTDDESATISISDIDDNTVSVANSSSARVDVRSPASFQFSYAYPYFSVIPGLNTVTVQDSDDIYINVGKVSLNSVTVQNSTDNIRVLLGDANQNTVTVRDSTFSSVKVTYGARNQVTVDKKNLQSVDFYKQSDQVYPV